jgi:serine/threonine-protein kinase
MVLVPAGPFEMGSENGESDEKPVHTVTLNDFYIDQFEVTNAQYAACVEGDVCDPPAKTNSATRDSYYGNAEYDDYPVIHVDWEQAKTYCEWRGGRLPTEAEWEKAARGTDGLTYPWGEQISCDRANYGSCVGDTTPVGTYPTGVSPYDVYDMIGNTAEWVQSRYRPYPYQVDDGRENFGGTNVRVLRGGSWYINDFVVRASNRSVKKPDNQNFNIGFRCAR